jgi:hypothetical protein
MDDVTIYSTAIVESFVSFVIALRAGRNGGD